ncbi:SDR family oxidoreductase [Ferruginivarius sediminum]|uniref:SDR family NAD(P)-dependent oxidoreductase n=1 Tax=Ferruginivarius sediminum TaxID=2661937 RepID=A0A369TAJ2_9PROT|nr:SDR family oxidoreductase [Ferruginivarius sediminum]RDD61514.1 SDR family NAD(P)-dependent oxidoreductase [Ferruginivarius sediminum]
MTSKRLFCFGLGYSARRLADRLLAEGWRVAGTTRDEAKAGELRAAGVEACVFDRGQPLADAATALAGTTHLLSSVPPNREGDPVLDHHAGDIAALAGRLAWAGYLSTTGVYGNREGGWVDEESELHPTSARAERRVAAEHAWLRLHAGQGIPVHVFRLAGIYGPGRSPLDAVRQGRAKRIDKPGQVFSRIHVEDIATVLQASMARPNPGRVYNVCDDEPAAPAEVTEHACRLLGVESPPLVALEDAGLSDMGKTFWQDNKRVSNRRMHEELGVRLAYPDYRTGLEALLGGGG